MKKDKILVTIVTGFLGSGKTTLIGEVLRRAPERRIALLVNEFGACGFDAALTCTALCDGKAPERIPRDIIELANGCVCCTVADDFVPALTSLMERDPPPDHIIIETSGLALPRPLVDAFNWPSVKGRAGLDGVVTVIDGPARIAGRYAADEQAVAAQRAADEALDHATPIETLYADQLSCADLVLIAKADLAAPADLARLHAELGAQLRPGVEIIEVQRGAVAPDIIMARGGAGTQHVRVDAPPHPHHHGPGEGHGHHGHGDDHDHDHDDFVSLSLDPPEFASLAALQVAVKAATALPGILRIKGAVRIAGRDALAVVQAVGPRVECWYSAHMNTGARLVAIALKHGDLASVRALLAPDAPAPGHGMPGMQGAAITAPSTGKAMGDAGSA